MTLLRSNWFSVGFMFAENKVLIEIKKNVKFLKRYLVCFNIILIKCVWPDQAGRDHCEMLVETLHVEHEIPTCAIQRYHEYESKISIEVYFKLLEADIE